MARTADCVVAGGGVVGLLTALELAEAGASVTLVDRSPVGRESSWAGGGILSALYPWRYPEPVLALSRWSQARYPDLAARVRAESGIDPEWERSGMLVLEDADAVEATAWARTEGVTVEPVDGEGARGIEPALAARWSAGLWLPGVAQIRNPRLCQGLRRMLVDRGVSVIEGLPVEDIAVSGGRVRGIRGGEVAIEAGTVVVAGGAWTPQILGPLAAGLPVEPVRGQMILFRAEPGLVRRIVLAQSRYLVPRRDGRVLAGSTLEHVGFDKSTTREARAELQGAAVALAPGLSLYPIEHHWSGLRPGSPLGVPIISEHPAVAGLFVNAGHFRNGVVMAPASARLAADLVLGRRPCVDPRPYVWPPA
jgi:glycine oxidase